MLGGQQRREDFPAPASIQGSIQSLLNALTPRITGAGPVALVQCMLGLGRWSMSGRSEVLSFDTSLQEK
ncbi:hypothetical protein Q7C36_023324 [Tachysurus vachellii]|uniref:Uncharacterized protein n=1 Tax=Tachysurus vachellii TaxID=175792 RepID=A0AA88IJN8_TACVA|nr:hypothetical protein Q7C36_023324 [Tachysurus vachellii]